ncbi:MAG: hypothetical protein IIW94_03780 [Clostridia bacterium]|nr:hypothetical protein [Clostridia bacterium]
MEEMIKENPSGQPVPEENTFSQGDEATTPKSADDNAFLEVKFNKETKKLTLEQAATLAQKGMKLDHISEELEILKALSAEKGVGLKEFVRGLKGESRNDKIGSLKEKYSADSELVALLDTLSPEKPDEMAEFAEHFPEVEKDAIPQEVKAAAEISGKGLLFEYLLYEHKRNLAAKSEEARQAVTREVSLGSVSCGTNHTADAEFIKSLWS